MKRNKLVYLFFLLFIPGFITPSYSQTDSDDLITIDVLKDLKKEKELRLSEVVDSVEYIKLETVPESLFGESQFVIGKKYIMVIQPYSGKPIQVYLFDRSGKFLRKIGREGKGPEEYSSIHDAIFSPDEDYIIVRDSNKKIFLEYDMSGKMIRRVNYPETINGYINSIRFLENGNILSFMMRPIYEMKNYNLIRIFDKNYNPVKEMFPVNSEKFKNPPGGSVTTGRSLIYIINNKIHFKESYSNKLYIEESNKLIAKYHFYIKDKPSGHFVPAAKLGKVKHTELTFIKEIGDLFIIGIRHLGKTAKKYDVLYNKKTGEKYKLASLKVFKKEGSNFGRKLNNNSKEDSFEKISGVYNDIDGLYNVGIRSFSSVSTHEKHIVNNLEIIDIKEYINKEYHLENDIKFHTKRKELFDLINSSSEDDNPILQIFHLKN